MKKASYTSKNSVAKLYKPISGMCNTISGEYIKENQACHIAGVIYNEDINSFSGSHLQGFIIFYIMVNSAFLQPTTAVFMILQTIKNTALKKTQFLAIL